MSDQVPRRIRLDLMTPAELAIMDAIYAVESAGADVRLTDAINLLSRARDKVADYVDGITQPTLRAMQIARITAERDELLAALKDCCDRHRAPDWPAIIRAEALIARIEGGK